MSGIRTFLDLKDRCRVNEETGCWEWGLGKSGNGQACAWIPLLQRRGSLGVLICALSTGKGPAPGVVWHCTCTTPDCARPAHREAGTRSTQMLAANLARSPMTVAKITKAKRAKSRLTDAQAAEIRESTEVNRVLAERYGISMSYASMIKRGEVRRRAIVRVSSVFNLAAACSSR